MKEIVYTVEVSFPIDFEDPTLGGPEDNIFEPPKTLEDVANYIEESVHEWNFVVVSARRRNWNNKKREFEEVGPIDLPPRKG